MKRIIPLLLCILFVIAGRAQTDSTEIRLQHYKDMFSKGLITANEYEELRKQTLGIQEQPVHGAVADTTIKVESKLFLKGEDDAKAYFRTAGVFGGTLSATVIGTPVLGLIPAVAFTLTDPKEKKLGYPDIDLWTNAEYKRGYIKEARKEKRANAWKAWGVGVAIDCLIGGIVEIAISTKNKK